MKYYQVRVDIYEEGGPRVPVVTHLFNGRTKKEAWAYHAAHLKSDKFLSQCELRGVFQKSVRCSVRVAGGWHYR